MDEHCGGSMRVAAAISASLSFDARENRVQLP
jgi:hypothetical protein